MRISLLFLLFSLQAIAQDDPPPPKPAAHEPELPFYRDSMARHENLSIHYAKHVCQNRHGKYGLYDAYHAELIPSKYDQLLWSDQHPNRPIIAILDKNYGAFDAKTCKLIVPFNYQNLFWEGNLLVGYPIGPLKWDRKVEVFNPNGKVLVTGVYERFRAWPDSTFWAYRFHNKGIERYSSQGQLMDTLPYFRAYPIAENAFKASAYAGWLTGSGEGLVDSTGKEILPNNFTHISWCNETWAQVNGKLPDGRGLYNFKEKRIYPFTKETLREPDALGNFVFEIGSWSDGVYYGLMDPKLQVIIRPKYKIMVHLRGSKQYLVETESGKRGLLNPDGTIAVDTLYRGFTPATFPMKQGGITVSYDTTAFYAFSDNNYNNYGLWHPGLGVVAEPMYRIAAPISQHLILLTRNDSSALFNLQLKQITKYYQTIQSCGNDGFLILARPYQSNDWVELDPKTGQELRPIPGLPRWLAFGTAFIQAHTAKYGLYDRNLLPLTELKYDQLNELEYLPKALKPKIIQNAKLPGYGRWVAWVGKDYNATEVLLLDEFGKEWLLK
jgi:hypothetical protein